MGKTHFLRNWLMLSIVAFFFSSTAFSQTSISDAAGLLSIKSNLSGSYKLTSDITLTGSWTPIANFTGTFDGDGHVIRNLTYNSTSSDLVALFASTNGATIKKVGIESANLVGKQNVAGIIGVMTGGTLEQCYVSNSYIQGTDHVASLVGQAVSNAIVKNCYATAYVYATSNNTGGLIGSAKEATLSKCYFSGLVRTAGANQQVAGLVGFIENGFTPKVDNSVNLAAFAITNGGTAMRIIPNVGRNAILTNNYSLSTTLLGTTYSLSALATAPTSGVDYGLTAKNGANLPNDADAKSSTFYSGTLGWDFNSTSGVWKMLTDGYPVLKWQSTPVKTTVLNSGAPENLDLLDVTKSALYSENSLDFSKLISSHGITLNVSSSSSKVSISNAKLATLSAGTIITADETVSVNISTANSNFTISNPVATVKLTQGGGPFSGLPVYPDGVISPVYNAGPGLAVDNVSTTTEDSKMVVISSTSAATFTSYVQSLLNKGFVQISTNSIENNVFYTFKYNNILYYLYYTDNNKQVRVIQDNSTRTLLTALDATTQGTGTTEFYLYSLDYTHGEGQTSKTDYWKIDCGATLVIKLKDNSLFIVDAGHERQSSNAAMEGFLNFMYKITGQNAGTTLNIRSWFYSHAHGDHVYFTYPFLEKYHNLINVQSVLFNIPSYQTMSSGYDSGTFLMKQVFNSYFPNCKYAKLHTGQKFSLQGVGFDVLHTHEDAVTTAGKTTIGNFNDTSTVLKLTIGGKTILLLGDASTVCQSDMLAMYTGATLLSDCVQTAHHGYNNLPSLYSAIKAPLALFCNSKENVSGDSYAGVINATTNVTPIFSDPYTVKITVENGSFKTENIPSYRSYFTTVKIPNLTVGTISTSGNRVDLDFVQNKVSLADQVIDKSVTGTGSISVSESCSLIMDGKTATKYCTDSIPATIAWTMKKPVTLKWYVIYSANDNAENAGRNPKQWKLSGSTNGTSWVDIDWVNNANLTNANYTGFAFEISNPVPYQYYALKTFANDGASVMQFSEMALFADVNTTSTSNILGSNESPFVIRSIGNKQIKINYNAKLSAETSVSVYNVLGQKLIVKNNIDDNTVVTVPSSGIYILTMKDLNTTTSLKIKID